MTPDQKLKTALVGEATHAGRKPRGAKPAKQSRAFRWTVRLLTLALMLMVSRGLMREPEVKLMLTDAVTAVVTFVAQERAAYDALAAAASVDQAETVEQVENTAASASAGLFADKVKVHRGAPNVEERTMSGPIETVLAGNAFVMAGVPVVLDGLVCAAPESDSGRKAVFGLRDITGTQDLRCSVTGAAGEHAVRARCRLQGGRDLALAMQVDQLCEAG
ncbi:MULTISPECIES: hypothetical protein [unclassified Marinovum]